MSILVFNAGSSSLKFSLFTADLQRLCHGQVDWQAACFEWRQGDAQLQSAALDDDDRGRAVGRLLAALPQEDSPVVAVGHRVVHGGEAFNGSVRLDARAKEAIAALSPLAPLHNPEALAVIEAAEQALPHAAQVAVFDTAFYASLEPAAYLYPVPHDWYSKWGVRRYGFHGISHAYCSRRAAELVPPSAAGLRLVSCHLGNGCSATAVRGGRAIATTMGFTPLEGLMMGTRSGSVDPGALLYVQRHHGLNAEELDGALNRRSGLLGLSDLSSDFREVDRAARGGNEQAAVALAVYAGRVKEAVGALAARMGGIDVLLFTGGVGENAADLRQSVCADLQFMGIEMDPRRNAAAQADCDVASDASPARILVLHTREEYAIAGETRALLD